MKLASPKSVGSLLASALVIALMALTGIASAGETVKQTTRAQQKHALEVSAKEGGVNPLANPGEVCNTNQRTWVFNAEFKELYNVEGGTPMRIEAYYGSEAYWGHAQYKANGQFARYVINQSSCHKT
jgi:hypothetical protein